MVEQLNCSHPPIFDLDFAMLNLPLAKPLSILLWWYNKYDHLTHVKSLSYWFLKAKKSHFLKNSRQVEAFEAFGPIYISLDLLPDKLFNFKHSPLALFSR